MSEQYNQEVGSQGQEIDDDPLAELARIVAGEPELNPSPQTHPIEEQMIPDASMEAALEEQLMQEFSVEDSLAGQVETPAFVDDINASIEEITNTELPHEEVQAEQLSPEPIVQESVQTEIPQPAADPEIGFQDGLIDALELEIGGAQEPVAEVQNAFTESAPNAVEPDIAAQEAALNVELSAANMQETLEQELASQFEPVAPIQEEPVNIVSEPIIDQPIASIEDDLGNAFANEFEQIAANQPEPIEEPFIALVSEPVLSQPQVSDPTPVAVGGDAELEMDFEAAFTQELESVSTPETEGWSQTETAEANAAFTAAVSPQPISPQQESVEANLDQMELDPGHVGSVDDISSVDAGVVVANDNGGGKKYAVAALVIALFAGVIAAGYGFLGGENSTVASATPEIIKADVAPVKVKPKDPGGLVPENQDNASYGDLGGENSAQVSQETLNSQTEEPLILNTGNSEANKSDDRLASSEDVGATPNANASSILPKVVQTVAVKPDGTIITKPAAPKVAAPKPLETALNAVTIGDAANVEVKPVTTQIIAKPEAIDGAKTTGDIKIPSASPVPKPIVKAKPKPVKVAAAPKPKKVAPAPVRKSEWVVQVSSQRSPEAAQSSFSSMRNKYSALQGRAMAIQRANLNGKTYYRVRVQTASKSDANQLCSSLASAGGSCFVTR